MAKKLNKSLNEFYTYDASIDGNNVKPEEESLNDENKIAGYYNIKDK